MESDKNTPWERCVVTQFLRMYTKEEMNKPCTLTWVDWFLPLVALPSFGFALAIFMHYFPNGIWSF